ncbi:TetR/AcrR family transcriptional regulator [Longispora albida]|uniref:TetR/AcrR family transcriptional regulator n=1 Tax=Longispora albida TaxID=203523 RepID=UPI00036B84EF|nr:TetR/AcrR family transcriptional regulator [Longispora albida]
MPRIKGDHEARRRDVSEAVWRVLARHGFGGLSMRAVATELGATTGLLTHYFPSKRDLITHALALLDERTAARRPRPSAAPGLASLREAMLAVLPATPESAGTGRIWVSSWDTALADEQFGSSHAARYAGGRERLSARIAAAQALGELAPGDADDLAAAAQSFLLGLVVQALLDPPSFPAARQIHLLDGYLATLA